MDSSPEALRALALAVAFPPDLGVDARQADGGAFDQRFGFVFCSVGPTDLLGAMRRHQLQELEIRARVQPTIDVIRAATVNAAALLGRDAHGDGQLGVIAHGAVADLIVVDGDPLADITALIPPGGRQPAVIQAGTLVSGSL